MVMKLPPGTERVARSLLQDGPGTAAEVARRLQVTATAARKHLDLLVTQGFASASEDPPFGPRRHRGRGRPARIFAITGPGRTALEQSYDALAQTALAFLEESGQLAAFAEHYARQLGDRLAPVSVLDRTDRPVALAAALTREGFAAEVVESASADGVQVCQHHCPVSEVAGRFPQLCEAETAVLAAVLGTHVLRLATIAHGDGVCTTHIPTATGSSLDRLGRTSA